MYSCVCIHVCVFMCVYSCVCIHVCVFMCVSLIVGVGTWPFLHSFTRYLLPFQHHQRVWVCVYLHPWVYVCACVCARGQVSVFVHVCVFAWV